MINDTQGTAAECKFCAVQRIKPVNRSSSICFLLPQTGPLDCFAMDILSPLPKTKYGNQYLFVLTYRYMKQAMVLPGTTVASMSIATVFVDNWVTQYGIPTYFLTDGRLLFLSKFLAAVAACFKIKQWTTTTHYPKTSRQAKGLN